MTTLRKYPRALDLFKATLPPLLLGAAICFGAVLFEELVTADLRWGLWVSGAALALAGAWLAGRGQGAWAAVLVSLPLLVLYGRIVVSELADLWPHLPLWLACPIAGWLGGRAWQATEGRGRKAVTALLAGTVLLALMVGYGGLFIPRLLAERLTVYLDEPAPEISLQNLDGEPYPMESLAGKVVVLDFFSTWCAPCIAELPELARVRNALSDRDDIVFLVVGAGGGGDTREDVAAFAESRGPDLIHLYDPESAAHDALGLQGVPTLAVISRDGRVRLQHVGFNAAETGFAERLEAFVTAL